MSSTRLRPHRGQLVRQKRGARRRGIEALEFALVFPLYLFVFFGIIEYGWYFFQRAIVADAARLGCQAAGQLDPVEDDFRGEAGLRMIEEIEAGMGIQCNDGTYLCEMTFPLDLSNFSIPRVTCQARMNFVPVTGFLGGLGGSSGGAQQLGIAGGVRLVPEFVTARSVAIFEEAE